MCPHWQLHLGSYNQAVTYPQHVLPPFAGDMELALLDGLGQRKRMRALAAAAKARNGSGGGSSQASGSGGVPPSGLQQGASGPAAAAAASAEADGSTAAAWGSNGRGGFRPDVGGGHWWHGSKVVEAAMERGGEPALHDLTRR